MAALELLASQAAISLENALLLAEEKASRTKAEVAERRAAFLADVGTTLGESLDYQETLVRLGRLCVSSLCDVCLIDVLEDGKIQRLAGATADPKKVPLLERIQRHYPPRWDSPHPAAEVLRTGKPVLLPEVSDEVLRRITEDDEHQRLARALASESMLSVPLLARGQTLGAVSMVSAAPGRYGPEDVELAEEVAGRAATAIDNARLYQASLKAVRLRDEFLSVASHELYTPITSLSLALAQIVRSAGGSRVAHLAALAERQGKRLTRLVGDLLDVTRIEAGRLPLTLDEVDLCVVARAVVERFEPDLSRGNCILRLRCEAPVVGRWDRSRVDQVISNLLSNAIKFGAGEPIEITIVRSDDVAVLTVTDHGIGVETDKQARIFDRFERGVTGQYYDGLGLGLHISHRIVEAHGGTIRVESRPGQGATFTVALPCSGQLSPTPRTERT